MYSHTYSHTLTQRFRPVSYIDADSVLRPQAGFRKACAGTARLETDASSVTESLAVVTYWKFNGTDSPFLIL
jgi:hypothetical protein